MSENGGVGFGERITHVEKDDGTWWVYCALCENDAAYVLPDGLPAEIKPMTDEQRRERVAPTVTFRCQLKCTRCRGKVILRRSTITATIQNVTV